jgi:molecular chaperone DnaK (HSP70)
MGKKLRGDEVPSMRLMTLSSNSNAQDRQILAMEERSTELGGGENLGALHEPKAAPAALNPSDEGTTQKAKGVKKKRSAKKKDEGGPGVWGLWFSGILLIASLPFINVYFPALTKQIVIGIDLGTTYSVVATCIGGEVHIIEQPDTGSRLLPSYVHFYERGGQLVGQGAKDLASSHAKDTVYDIKRIIGRTFDDPIVQSEIQTFPFAVVASDDSPPMPVIMVPHNNPRPYYATNVSSFVLSTLKERLEKHFRVRYLLGWRVNSATISVPANFDIPQKLATLEAARQAGFKSVQLISEPAAAALAYRLNKLPGVTNVLVYDFGGGTLDVALLVLDREQFNVITTSGDPHLGGEDIDRRLLAHLFKLFEEQTGLNARHDYSASEKLKAAAENIKVRLSSEDEVHATVTGVHKDRDLQVTLSRDQFEALCGDLFDRSLEPVRQILLNSEMRKGEIGHVVLVGGSSRIPKVRSLLTDFFDGAELKTGLNADEAIARGAALTRKCD